jgi:uncharacterized integral membrane protein
MLAIVFVAQNTQAIETNLLFATVITPQAVLLFITLAVGAVNGILGAGRISWKPAPRARP